MSTTSSNASFSDRQAAYANWRNRLRDGVESNKVIDLTEPEADEASPWDPSSLFVWNEPVDDVSPD